MNPSQPASLGSLQALLRRLSEWESRRLETAFTSATLLLLLVSLLEEPLGFSPGAALAVNLAAYLTGGWWAAVKTLPRLFRLELDVDFLMLLAAIGAALVGSWHEGIILLFLFSLSNTLQSYAMERSRRAIDDLIQERPKEATVRRDGRELTLSIEEVRVRDVMILRPGQMAPTDGVVFSGLSEMNESSITGESRMASKEPGDPVYAGAINGTGTLDIEVTRPASDSTLARIVRMVESAREHKAKTQSFLERFESWYAWGILSAVVLLIVIPLLLGRPFQSTFYRAMVVLVVASPCALIVSTPASILFAIARGARQRILFKGGAYLERMSDTRVVVFDKTGTLTTGKPGVTDVILARRPPPGFREGDLLAYAAALESRSEHPIAREIVIAAEARGLSLPPLRSFVALPGRGIHAELDGYKVWIGGHRLFLEHGEEVPADLLPEDKVKYIERLRQQHRHVMMIGDGVNDAPALANASIGIAMGAAGTDLAMESAHCVLMGNQLSNVAFALDLSRRAIRIIRQNLAFSIAVILLLVMSVFFFSLPLPFGVVGHEGSTLLVCLNGMRLLGYRPTYLACPKSQATT